MRGGTVYALKWDGYRGALTVGDGGVRLSSRQDKDLSPGFPDLVDGGAAVIPPGRVVDGGVVVCHQGHLNFS